MHRPTVSVDLILKRGKKKRVSKIRTRFLRGAPERITRRGAGLRIYLQELEVRSARVCVCGGVCASERERKQTSLRAEPHRCEPQETNRARRRCSARR